ncbi:MAG: response regulator, partial [Muribaculaceae bacterium]|nr:response regulator [Muribaculaceae bacterium]
HNTNWVYALIEDGDYFWAGSFLHGIHLVHKSKLKGNGCTVVSDLSLNSDKNTSGQTALANDFVNNVVKDNNGNIWILLFRDNALTRYTPSTGASERYDIHELTGEYPTHICSDRSGRIWCAFEGGAAVFESDGSCNTITFPHTNGDESVLAMGEVGNGVWISTQSNVWEIDGSTLKATLLPIPQNSYTAIYEDTTAGKVLLGGTDEILEADYSNIGSATDYNTIKMVLHEQAGGCLNLSNLQGGASGLTIPYGGNASLVVSTLDYSPWALQRYMYKISESPADSTGEWIVMPEGANTITFSDMKMGHCHLLLKKVGSPMQPLSIPLTVKAPNALSWWAICVYALIAAGVIYWVFWYTKRCNLESFREQERQTALENVERKLSFLSDISHDLKTPLSMIIGPVSLMKERAKDQESKKIFETIYDNAVRLNNMIHRTLELQHLEDADESLLILSTFDVVEFCHSVFEVFNENNPQKKFIFHASCPEILIEADAVKLESVITNLLSNACKYSDDSATISCGISKQDDNVEIVVSDDGVGIADTDQTLVFQRMFRSPATSKLREGTGLGLYLIKKYLELMKGNINLYSKEGQGTTFVVTLPISEKVRPQSPRNPESHSPDIPKILIVEDNIQIYGFIMELLGDEYTCFTAENGRSGLAIAASIIPDLIIVDEMMPIMSGLEMVRRMKQHPRL